MNKIIKRDYQIDFLRFLGLSFIILAHVIPPYYLFHIRTFDVVLMVFVSGLVYQGKHIDSIYSFIIHRFKRLIFPVYIFLTLYFLLVGVLRCFNIDFGITYNHIIRSYLLLDGIGYVWIIRVFLLVALATPFLLKINYLIKNNKVFLILNIFIILCLTYLINSGIGMKNIFVREYIYYLIGYSMIFLIGIRVKNFNRSQLLKFIYVLLLGMLLAFVIFYNKTGQWFIPFNNYKYPPRFFYVFYGISVSTILYLISRNIHKNIKIISFIGSNTIWIYLFHIPVVQILLNFSHLSWYYNYIILYIVSVIVYFVFSLIVDRLSMRFKHPIFKYLKG